MKDVSRRRFLGATGAGAAAVSAGAAAFARWCQVLISD